jgi:hypothetical protein
LNRPISPAKLIVEIFNKEAVMGTVNFSVADEIKARFNKTFKGRNKSAVLSRLMEEAVEREERRKRRIKAIDELLALRSTSRAARHKKRRRPSDAEIRKAREHGRP